MKDQQTANAPIWSPSPERVANSNMRRFIAFAAKRTGMQFQNYPSLYEWSVEDPGTFWSAIWEFAEIKHSAGFETALSGTEIRTAEWFKGARLNFAENLLRYRDNHGAITFWCEDEAARYITYRSLYELVARCAEGLKQLGVQKGDRVAALIANVPEAIIGMLATTSIGAIWSSCSPDFGFQGVLDRFGQITPKVLITANGYQYHGKRISSLDTIKHIADTIPSIEKIVLIPKLAELETSIGDKSILWENLLDNKVSEIEFAQLPFDHPVYIMYSSGTTGVPKCIVHGGGGTLLQHFKELILHTDLRRDDTITYFTTCGWMMWNWLVSSLGVGATLFLYDGSPSHPNLEILFKAIEEERISIFGTSPKFISSCENAELHPKDSFDLSSLSTILSTGAPLSVANFEYVYREIKPDLQLSSISGGTDIVSCFMLGNPMLPVYPGELQCRGLGMKVQTYNDQGQPVIGEVGELVCAAPFPSRPVYFWNDPGGEKYRRAYFDYFPGVWRHGDYILINEHGGCIVYGRSDATLNPGGVRIGTAEIYGPVESMPEIEESVVIGQKFGDDTRVILFVVPKTGYQLDDDLKQRIRDRIRAERTPRHVPKLILPIREVPRTINGKKVEIAVTRIVHGLDVPNRDALANPDSLAQFVDIPELKAG